MAKRDFSIQRVKEALGSVLKRARFWILGVALVGLGGVIVLIAFPSLKFRIYKHLPVPVRFWISSADSDKFLVGIIMFIEQDGRLMLVRHTYQDNWGLPGGWLENGETIEEGARREIREEFGIEADSAKLLKVNAVKSKPVIDIVISLRLLGTPIPDQLEVRGVRFFPVDSLPKETIRTHEPYIREYLSSRAK